MFQPKTDRIKQLAERYPYRIIELEHIFDKPTNIYIDFANVMGWQERLGWHISLKRLKQLLDSFDTVRDVKFYSGTLVGDVSSENLIKEVKSYKKIYLPDAETIVRQVQGIFDQKYSTSNLL